MEYPNIMDSIDVISTLRKDGRIRRQNKREIVHNESLSDKEFKNKYRMTKETFENLYEMVEDDISIDNKGGGISGRIRLLVALRYYACGCFQQVHADIKFVSQPTVSRILKDVSKILSSYSRVNIDFLDKNSCEEMAEKFKAVANFPDVIGLIDCTHIKVIYARKKL